ncbi:hypothetical protein [Helicobacter pylori]|uniref:hypothetical protein n=1 Tax=Helicobacter pylori TaxID=210 RepID=UPI001FF3CC45|nr:hypothetical protein [Helicobacter pylori]MCK0501669.1 hypothetical protein [Helicobacter pylori]
MAVRFGVIFITDNYTIDSVSQISQYQKKNIFNGLIKTIYGCIDDENAFLELENNKTINDLNLQDLWEKLKTQAFPLSDIITNAINQKEGVALDYALINDIKYNLLDNTFYFIFNIDLHLIDD